MGWLGGATMGMMWSTNFITKMRIRIAVGFFGLQLLSSFQFPPGFFTFQTRSVLHGNRCFSRLRHAASSYAINPFISKHTPSPRKKQTSLLMGGGGRDEPAVATQGREGLVYILVQYVAVCDTFVSGLISRLPDIIQTSALSCRS